MAGEFGAISSTSRPVLPIYLPEQPRRLNSSNQTPPPQLPFSRSRRPRIPTSIAMAATNGAAADSVQEPPHKITKIAPLLKVKKLSEKAILPSRGSASAAGYDLSSAADAVVPARGKALVPTDLSIAIPEGTYARVAPRSGLALKHSIDVGAGVIDADYRGPVGVVLFNHSEVDFVVKPGDRIAQMIIEVIVTPEVAEVEDLDATVRGEGGFGSTGV
ncbi:LOW QUALITY PROTEIN: deoxyuridine 5'-triphosphate nucleotidohydrolase [Brachypodium distachyon]|uniref:LOW QUALITY PROTEIN: deoxyuridine 5'-triphosphate nucleotidohydrolase n=1 Tax=Brachypodium distachyon TaxID=15368 RepID=UPI00052FE820|nr:LOW QUALITY PROTEIN: deoxyuridine 5'-triphosphate nucleotidohydrolase [Brachypodium distachyon]|eukprot:XP_010231696.3 LOW QUALITY PROTEIN: deoxyuridine 5'-triphosphate nucleotidohydrolase [Brachypodium distachyon]